MTKKIPNAVLRNIVEWAIAIATALLVYFILRSYVFRIADVTGQSMEPTLNDGDYVMLSKVGYWFGEPKTGDIIAFPYKEKPTKFFIKRVVGVPGDEIDWQDGRFTVNGQVTDVGFEYEEYEVRGDIVLPMTVPAGYFFVLGDNRNLSHDSRYQEVGLIPKTDIVGKAVMRFWPLTGFGSVEIFK